MTQYGDVPFLSERVFLFGMTQPNTPDSPELTPEERTADNGAGDSSFGDILSQFEQSHRGGGETVDGTVVSVTADGIFVDIGRKTDGVLRPDPNVTLAPGQKVRVSFRGYDDEGNVLLSTIKVEQPKDWTALETAFANKSIIAGRVVEQVKGGLRVDVGVPAFMPASRSGVRDVAGLAELVGQEIECRITKLDTSAEDVVVDRRAILEERERASKQEAFERIQVNDVVTGTVRTITDFGAFVDIGGFDGLLHVADMSYARGLKPADIVSPNQQLQVKVLKVNRETRKVSLGLKQLAPDPWEVAAQKYAVGQRVQGKVTRVTDFGAFVELEPGLEGLIHVSEMSWLRKNVRSVDILKPGEMADAMILGVNPSEKRIALSLKQALGDPWEDALKNHPVGSVVDAPVTSLAKFGAFVDLGDGIEGMIHIGDISHEKRLNHPSEALKVGEIVHAQVIEADPERRRLRLGIKQLQPTHIDEYIAEHKVGDSVSGRVIDANASRAKVELGEGVTAICKLAEKKTAEKSANAAKADLSSLSAMLSEKWKSGPSAPVATDTLRSGQIRSFKIVNLDTEQKRIDLELV